MKKNDIMNVPVVVPETKIFCDMDGVLVDFETGAIGMINDFLSEKPLPWAKRDRRFFFLINKLRDELGDQWEMTSSSDLDIGVVRQFLYGAVSLNPGEYFRTLPPFVDGTGDLWATITSSAHDVYLLTAGIGGKQGVPTAADGKKAWASNWLNPTPDPGRVIVVSKTRQKIVYAMLGGVPNILIDDRKGTIDEWNAAGGIGILHIQGQSLNTIQVLENIGI